MARPVLLIIILYPPWYLSWLHPPHTTTFVACICVKLSLPHTTPLSLHYSSSLDDCLNPLPRHANCALHVAYITPVCAYRGCARCSTYGSQWHRASKRASKALWRDFCVDNFCTSHVSHEYPREPSLTRDEFLPKFLPLLVSTCTQACFSGFSDRGCFSVDYFRLKVGLPKYMLCLSATCLVSGKPHWVLEITVFSQWH